MVSIMFMLLIGVVAIATDTGLIWMNRRSLQNSADAAALAGAQQLPNNTASAIGDGCTYATVKNAVQSMFGKVATDNCANADLQVSQTYVPNDTIKATAYKTINPIFGIALDFASIEISATATAVVGSIHTHCPFPFYQTADQLPGGSAGNLQFYTQIALHLEAGTQPNDYLTVDVGQGGAGILHAMTQESCGQPLPNPFQIKSGGTQGPVEDGFQWRLYCAGDSEYPKKPNNVKPDCPTPREQSTCPDNYLSVANNYLVNTEAGLELSPHITRANCLRLVVLPIAPPGPYANNQKSRALVGFAVFYISGFCNKNSCDHPTFGTLKQGQAWGYYVRMAADADLFHGYDGLGTKVIALIK